MGLINNKDFSARVLYVELYSGNKSLLINKYYDEIKFNNNELLLNDDFCVSYNDIISLELYEFYAVIRLSSYKEKHNTQIGTDSKIKIYSNCSKKLEHGISLIRNFLQNRVIPA